MGGAAIGIASGISVAAKSIWLSEIATSGVRIEKLIGTHATCLGVSLSRQA
jgi:hypothetical protein